MIETMSGQSFPFGPKGCACGGTLRIRARFFHSSNPHTPAAECQQCGFVWGVA